MSPFHVIFFCVEELVWIVTRQRTGVERCVRAVCVLRAVLEKKSC